MVAVFENLEAKMFENHSSFLSKYITDIQKVTDLIENIRADEDAGKLAIFSS